MERPKALGLRRSFTAGLQQVSLTTPTGIYLGEATTYHVNLDRLAAVARRIVKGLFYHHRRSRLPDMCAVRAYPVSGFHGLDQDTVEGFRDEIREMLTNLPTHTCGRVLSYWFSSDASDPYLSAWLMLFFGRAGFIAYTENQTRE
jgi:hypothetical protein